MTTCKRRRCRRPSSGGIFLFCCALLALCHLAVGKPDIDLYQLLGVTRSASTKEIKKAYRKKALDTHPDKNKSVPPQQAAETFRKVVEAFEVLSDASSRKHYDRFGTTASSGSNSNHNSSSRQQHRSSSFQWNWYSNRRPTRLKDKFEVKQAQSRVLHVISLAQLLTIMLDDDNRLERNLLVCLTTPLTAQHADDDMVFPYPFAHMSSQGIWWEDMLQTVRIQFYRSSELSRFFGVTAEQANAEPVFVFLPRGAVLEESAEHFPRISTRDRQAFENWAWQQIEVEVHFRNDHDHEVEVYWIHGSRAQKKLDLQPGEKKTHTSMLSHEWYFRDTRIDTFPNNPGRYKLTENSSLGSVKILSDESPQEIVIPHKTCFDLSGHCSFWQGQGECRKNPNFMREQCAKTCHHCTENDESHRSSQSDEL